MQGTAEQGGAPAFQRYRSGSKPVTLPRLIAGIAVILVVWIAATIAALGLSHGVAAAIPGLASNRQLDMVMLLLSLGGLWAGVWLAMRFIHKEPLSLLFGNGQRLDWRDFARAAIAAGMALALTELALLALGFDARRGGTGILFWLAAGLPVALLALLQTSAEEIVFRGYLMQRLANRFRSPLVWALLPGLAFTLLHVDTSMSSGLLAFNVISIGTITVLLAWLLVCTGNLGAAMGLHMANNFFIFWVLEHQPEFGAFALWSGTPVAGLVSSGASLAAVLLATTMGLVLTVAMLFWRRSPLALSTVRMPADAAGAGGTS